MVRVTDRNKPGRNSKFDFYSVAPFNAIPLPVEEICEAVGMRSPCDLVDIDTFTEKMCQNRKPIDEHYKHYGYAICANNAVDNPNPRTGLYRLGTGDLFFGGKVIKQNSSLWRRMMEKLGATEA